MRANRRHILLGAVSALAVSALPARAQMVGGKTDNGFDEKIAELFGDKDIAAEKVTLKVPPLSENGNSVAFSISVDAPMTDKLFVKRVVLLSPRNPIPLIAQFNFTPASGKADVSGRMRLAGTQTLTAIAEMCDGTLYEGQAETTVTLAACILY